MRGHFVPYQGLRPLEWVGDEMSAVAATQSVAKAKAYDEDESVRIVRSTLKGPVIQTLRRLVPELNRVDEVAAYDHALGDLTLLESCFKTFREYRPQFNSVLVDSKGQLVKDDSTFLACGHNLEQVVAMIVRTSAKRYFRHNVRPPIGLAASSKAPLQGLIGRLRTQIVPGSSRLRTTAEELYDSIKSYLLFEWQVPLVPTYAKFSPKQVEDLGKRILDYGDVVGLSRATGLPVPASANVKTLVAMPSLAERKRASLAKPVAAPATPIPAVSPPKPVASSPMKRQEPAKVSEPAGRIVPMTPPKARPVMTQPAPGGKKLSGASFIPILELAQVQAVLHPSLIGPHSVVIIDKVGPKAWVQLVLSLGMRRKDQLAVLLLSAFSVLGRDGFEDYFGQNADPSLLEGLIESTHPSNLGAGSSLSEVVTFAVNTFGARQKRVS